jgi:hypothetical protein
METSIDDAAQKASMPPPPSKTMLSYFTKIPSKGVKVKEANSRKLAPAFNKQHVENFQNTRLNQFDAELYNNQTSPNFFVNYLKSIKSGQHKPFRLQRKPRGPLRAKLLQYHEDIRPPYWGTWQKKSKIITGRRPLAQDEDIFDYEVDSEAEWDYGGPGESLKGDDSEDDEELDDYEIDMKTFVPHGYVSDDEVETHSDQEESPSANQSLDENCDYEDSNMSVQIIGEKGPSGIPIAQQDRPQQQQPQPKQVVCEPLPIQQTPFSKPKQEIKPISLGIYYEDTSSILNESKIQFLRAFQGVACKDC